MAFLKLFVFISLISTITGLTGCGARNEPANVANASPTNSAQTEVKANSSVEELALLVNFNLVPEDLIWRRDEKSKTLVAVVRLNAEDAKKLSEQLAARAPGSPHNVQVDDWFPAELVAQSEAGGGSTVQGTGFPADDFYQEPFTKGVVVRVDGSEFFVIELAAG